MRLLHLTQSAPMTLEWFDDDVLPEYAILSHTWGSHEEEVTYKQFIRDSPFFPTRARGLPEYCWLEETKAYQKIDFAARAAAEDGLSYFWVDTCCIDKENSAELSEAINSMFKWYQQATKCYVYLSDVHLKPNTDDWRHDFRQSRWFTRGWTLQELIAPRQVEFFASQGEKLGTRAQLASLISQITGTDTRLLTCSEAVSLADFSVKKRMSWAVKRRTTRVEDKAYSLLGIFGVKMPIRYGEGTAAFQRFQAAVLGGNDEKVVFRWPSLSNQGYPRGSCQDGQRAETSLGVSFRASEKSGNSKIRSESDSKRDGETIGSDEEWRTQTAVSRVAKLALHEMNVFPGQTSKVYGWSSLEDVKQRLWRCVCPEASKSALSGSENEEYGLEGGKLQHETVRLSTCNQGPRLFTGPLRAQERHKNQETNNRAREMERGSVDDSGSDTESTDWDSSSETSSDFSEDQNQVVLNTFVDIAVEQIARRAYVPASMLTLPQNPPSFLGRQGDLNLGSREADTDRGYKRKAEHVDGRYARTDNRNSHRMKFVQQ